jgi:hypothetical protein
MMWMAPYQRWFDFLLVSGRVRILRMVALARRSPIRKIVSSIFSKDTASRIPIFASVTEYTHVFDPCVPAFHWWWIYGSFDEIQPERCGMLGSVPAYYNIAGMNRDQAISILLRSSALPLVFPVMEPAGSKGDHGRFSTDGGWADNTPIAPLLDVDCDVIVVVHLNNDAQRARESERRLAYTRRLYQLQQIGREKLFAIWWRRATRRAQPRLTPDMFFSPDRMERSGLLANFLYNPFMRWRLRVAGKRLVASSRVPRPSPSVCLLRDLPSRSIRIYHHVPRVDLGGFFRGTLNFRRQKSDSLMELGRREGQELIVKLLAQRKGRPE